MARYIALDLDQRQVRLLAVATGRGGARFEQALSYTFSEDLTPSSGESLGKLLREHLKQQGVQPAPLLACVGRDRVILKEVRFPAVSQNEEAALVRFQASKELTEPASEVVIDYFLLSDRGEPGPRLAMAMVLRRDLLQALHALARGMGLKLLGVAPRPMAMAAALERAGVASATESVAVVNVNDRWAEFCVLQGGKPRFSRSLLTTATLMQDVKRSLMLYAGQTGEGNLPQVLYLGGKPSAETCAAWRGAVGLKVEGLDPFQSTDKAVPDPERGAYLAVAGLGHLAGAFPEWPVNFVRPKEGGPPKGENKKKLMILAGAAGGVLLLIMLLGFVYVMVRSAEVATLRTEEEGLDAQIKMLMPDKPAADALKEWDSGALSWLDEMYDISANFPHVEGLRINQLNATTLVRKGASDRFSGRITVQGQVRRDKTHLVKEFVDAMMASRRGEEPKTAPMLAKGPISKLQSVRVSGESYKPVSDTVQQFELKIDVVKHAPTEFRTVLASPKGEPKAKSRPGVNFRPVAKAEPKAENDQ